MNNKKLYESIMRNINNHLSDMLNEDSDDQAKRLLRFVRDMEMDTAEKSKKYGLSYHQYVYIRDAYIKYQNKEISEEQLYAAADKIIDGIQKIVPRENKNIQELLDIHTEIYKKNPEDLFNRRIDLSKFINFILEDNTVVPLHEYNKDMNPVFLKMTDPDLSKNGNEIIIALNNNCLISDSKMKWETESTKIMSQEYNFNESNLKYDFNGFMNTVKIIKISKDQPYQTPAIDYVKNIKYSGYQAFVPATGQLYKIAQMWRSIQYIQQYIGIKPANYMPTLWSSTESYKYAGSFDPEFGLIAADKYLQYKVLPIFKKLN